MEMKRSFETNMMKVMVESVSYTGSAFGSNEDGDTVFFNQRLVEKVALEMGDIVEAYAIPNYEDKRDDTPWRAIKVSPEKIMVDIATPNVLGIAVPEVFARTAAELDDEVFNILGRDEETSYWTSSDLADGQLMPSPVQQVADCEGRCPWWAQPRAGNILPVGPQCGPVSLGVAGRYHVAYVLATSRRATWLGKS